MRIKCWPVEPQAGGWAAGKTMTALPAARTTEMIASDIPPAPSPLPTARDNQRVKARQAVDTGLRARHPAASRRRPSCSNSLVVQAYA